MDQKDKDNFQGMIKKCLKQAQVYIHKDFELMFPFFSTQLIDQMYRLIRQKLKATSEIYEQTDIYFMIVSKTAEALNYEEHRSSFSPEASEKGFVWVGGLRDFVDESEYTNIANKIIEELENPSRSYALVYLPNVELSENIKIAKGLFLVADIADYFRVDDKNKNSSFQLERHQTYLLIEQVGRSWAIFEQSIIHKKILLVMKAFLGLSMIAGIFDTSKAYHKEKRDIAIGVFSVADEWSEGLWSEGASEEEEESGIYDPISEDHPDFEDLRAAYSGGDALAEFCFQKRFFFEEEINLSEAHVKLLSLISISEYATKPSFSLITGEIAQPLTQFEKLETPGEFLEKRLDEIRGILDSEDDYAERIKTASLWYLEGYCAEDETFKFIVYTIAIESLFGRTDEGANSKDTKGNPPLTQTLSDRCGFTLGKSLKQKEEITKDFTRIYGIRSDIVHRRKVILKKDDKDCLRQLENMTKEIIGSAITTYGEAA